MPPAGLTPMLSFARIKPASADRPGGAAAAKVIAGWDEAGGSVTMSGTPPGKGAFDHFDAALPPEASQQHVYDTACAPLVARFLDGFDVDLIVYGQTGSGKTYTMFGPPRSMAAAAEQGEAFSSPAPEHGFCLRAGLECLESVAALAAQGVGAVLHGSMVEISILSFTDQTCCDLLNGRTPCYIDDNHHLQGAKQIPLRGKGDVVRMAAGVEERMVRGTRMNDTSSRSHCITVFTLTVLRDGAVRQSRLNFWDLVSRRRSVAIAIDLCRRHTAPSAPLTLLQMGSERFKGANAAHDSSQSSKSTTSGFEGIFANLSLGQLRLTVETTAKARKLGKAPKESKASTSIDARPARSLRPAHPSPPRPSVRLHPDQADVREPDRRRVDRNDHVPVAVGEKRRRELHVAQIQQGYGRPD